MSTTESRHEVDEILPLPTPFSAAERELLIEDLHRRYAGVLYGKCLRVLRERSQAEDAVQEVFLIAYRVAERIAALPHRLHLAWLHQTCTYVCLHELRTRRRHVLANDADAGEGAELALGHQAGPQEGLEVAELVERVMASLDERNREIVRAHFLEGRTQEEIAPELSISRRAVVKRLARIRQAFAQAFAPAPILQGAAS